MIGSLCILQYDSTMTVEQIISIPDDRRIFIELPHSIPIGAKARVEICVLTADTTVITEGQSDSLFPPLKKIEEVRELLQKEMSDRGTSAMIAATGDGWETHVREQYAEP